MLLLKSLRFNKIVRCVSLCHGSLCHMVRGPHCWISSPRLTQPVTQPRLHHTNLPPPPPPPSLKTPGLVWRGLVTSWCGLGTPCLVIDIFYAFLLNLWDNPWQDPTVAIIHSLDSALRLNTLFSICSPVFIPFVNELILYSYHTECFISALNNISRFQANEYLVLLWFWIRIAVTNTDFIP